MKVSSCKRVDRRLSWAILPPNWHKLIFYVRTVLSQCSGKHDNGYGLGMSQTAEPILAVFHMDFTLPQPTNAKTSNITENMHIHNTYFLLNTGQYHYARICSLSLILMLPRDTVTSTFEK
jgi:hypothetical protein